MAPPTTGEKDVEKEVAIQGNGFSTHDDRAPSQDGSAPVTDPRLERAIARKFDRHLLPWLFGIWLLAFIDRSNIGNARIQGLAAELHLDVENRFNIALGRSPPHPRPYSICKC